MEKDIVTTHACEADRGDGRARCARMIPLSATRCRDHQGSPRATEPKKILFKLKLNEDRYVARFRAAGVNGFLRPQTAIKDLEHAKQAEALGRDPRRFNRPVTDSGVPVFGEGGLHKVSLAEVWEELLRKFKITHIHFEPSTNPAMRIMVVVLEDVVSTNWATAPEFLEEMGNLVRDKPVLNCHVWANPLKDGKVTHTLNANGFPQLAGSKAEVIVRYADGLWGFVPIEKAAS